MSKALLPVIPADMEIHPDNRRLGIGRFAEVWLGKWKSKEYALKQLIRGSGMNTASFFHESELISEVNDPGVAKVFFTGIFQGKPTIVTEFIDGVTLAELIFSPTDLGLQRGVGQKALSYICEKVGRTLDRIFKYEDLVHRDVKPENIVMRGLTKQMLEHLADEFDKDCVPEEILDPVLVDFNLAHTCLLYTSPSPRDRTRSRMPSSA